MLVYLLAVHYVENGEIGMYRILILSMMFCFAFSNVTAFADENALRVMTFNIRYNNPGDGINAWPNRKDHVADMIGTKHKADLAGLQEALKGQIDDLQDRLDDYAWFGVGRDDGKDKGEYCPIFYRKTRFELLEKGTFWLSETPTVPGSRSWDAAITRIVTWGKFKDLKNEKTFYMFNTHFDHRGREARFESAKLITQKAPKIAGDTPYFITGDFNLRETTDAYAVLAGGESPFEDARYASKKPHEGPTATFTRNQWTELGPPESKIDYLFVKKGLGVLTHKVLDDQYDGRFPSDHLPVLAEINLK